MFAEITAAIDQDQALKAAGLGLRDGSPVTAEVPIYHGGRGGFDMGDTILPPSVTGYLRPQACSVQSGRSVPWLENKPSYRSDYAYATRDMRLARDHAAGFSNWSMITSAADVMPRLGSVYEVEPLNCPLELDFPVHGCCCLQVHPFYEPCMFRAKRFTVTRVVEKDIQAVWSSDWRLMLKNLEAAYKTWTEQKGSDWYARDQLR